MSDRQLARKLRKQLRRGERLLKGTDPGSDLHHRVSHRLTQLRAIIEELRKRSDDVFDLPEGTIYPALHRMERSGMVTSRWTEGAGRRRRVYQLSNLGREKLGEKQAEWQAFTRSVRLVLKGA